MTAFNTHRAEEFLAGIKGADIPDVPLSAVSADEFDTSDDAVIDPKSLNLGMLGLIELILKRGRLLDRLIRDPRLQPTLLPRLLAISLISFVFFGVAMSLVLSCSRAWPELVAISDRLSNPALSLVTFRETSGIADHWQDGSVWKLMAAYAFGLIATTGVCLPSLYFYGLLAGVRMSLLDVTLQALRSKATTAIALVGILPIYAAVGMGIVIFDASDTLRTGAFWLGLILPFIAGLWGTAALFQSFSKLCDTLPPNRRHARTCFLRRLVLSWAACYTAVSPVMIFTLWERLAR